jgi:hypothetical protein
MNILAMNQDIGALRTKALDDLKDALSADGTAGSRTTAILDAEDVLQAMIALTDTVKQKGYKYS